MNVGLIGLGRLGRVYARDLSSRIAQTRLVGGGRYERRGHARQWLRSSMCRAPTTTRRSLIADSDVDAVVIVSPTHTHRELVVAALKRRSRRSARSRRRLTLAEARPWRDAEQRSGTFFQMGFMRRFDPGYAAAKRQIDEGRIGRPVVFKSTSRDPFPPSVEYANPKSSGGILIDMGIHDFDLARWFMGDVATCRRSAARWSFPNWRTVGDNDNVIATLTFADGRLGVIDLTRNGFYGYDISTELLGPEGTIRIGYIRETPLLVMTRNNIAHDTVPYFMERFERAYTLQLENFADNVLKQRAAPITIHDGVEALRIAVAATRACESGQVVKVSSIIPERV